MPPVLKQIDPKTISEAGANFRVINTKTPEWDEFVRSIASGIHTPLFVNQTDDGLMLIAGHRRLKAALQVKIAEVPCLVWNNLSEADAGAVRVVENMQREGLTPIEEGLQINDTLKLPGASVEVIADAWGKDPKWIVRRARLALLDPALIRELRSGEIDKDLSPKRNEPLTEWTTGALVVLACQPMDKHVTIVNEFFEIPTADELREYLDREQRDLKKAVFDTERDYGSGEKGQACTKCPDRTGAQPDLFDAPGKGLGFCLNGQCFAAKTKACVIGNGIAFLGKSGNSMQPLVSAERKSDIVIEGRPAMTAGMWTPAKKGDKGAIQAFDVDTAKPVWVAIPKAPTAAAPSVVERKLDDATTAKGRAIGQDGQVNPLTLQERQALLERKRQFHAIWAVREALMACPLEKTEIGKSGPPTLQLLELVACFGTANIEGFKPAAWLGPLDEGKVLDTVWGQVQQTMYRVITIDSQAMVTAERVRLARAMADLIGTPWSQLMDEATKEIPEPKSWAKDATGKAGAV